MRWIAAGAVCLVLATLTASVRADDWSARRDPFDPVVVRRYKAILARDPHDENAFHQLLGLYQRYRTVAKLEAEYRAQLDAGDDAPTLVVLARLPRASRSETIALWKRALAANPDDALGWLALGDAATTDAAAARDAYRRAVTLVTAPRDKRVALTKLIAAAQTVGDPRTVDDAYAALIALAPKDGTLWLDRGKAQLAAKQLAPALDSFATAESLLGTDPERQLSAMTEHAIALDALGRTDAAIAEYEHTLDKVPSGYFLRDELVQRIVDADRRRGQLASAIARLDKRWPDRTRGYFEWATLGDLYKEGRDDGHAIDAYQRAVAKAPTEVATQRKLIALLDKLRPADALAQHEAAARVAPGDADLQIELAKRYYPAQTAKALATLAALARRMTGNVNVRSTIAGLYEQWNELGRAIGEYEAIAAIEPKDPDHAIVLGEAYWRADNQTKARAAWQRLDKIKTPLSLFRHGEVLATHDLWEDAIVAYTQSLALDDTNADAWYGRGRAADALSRFPAAIADARRAVALTGYATLADGLRNRQLLVRVLGHARSAGERDGLVPALATWRFAFDHGDVAAGYLLAAHHAHIGSRQLHGVLVDLEHLVPTDDSLAIALARSFVHRREFARARRELEQVAHRTPARAGEIAKLVVQVDKDREQSEREIRWEEEGRSSTGVAGSPDLAGRDRFGMRLELGSDVHDASGALLGVGLYTTHGIARGTTFAVRFDWTKRNGEMEEVDAIELAGGVTTRIIDARKFELAVGIAPRFELRYGYDAARSPWNRAGLAGDLVLELMPRAVPATLGIRFDQNLTDAATSSALLVELGFEVR
jgi:tetratricopeptide (TPR) repeat protein